MVSDVSRRAALATALALPLAGGLGAWSLWLRTHRPGWDGVIDLDWNDLLPEDAATPAIAGVVQHAQIASYFGQPASTGVREDWADQRIRLPGYVVPVLFDGDLVQDFILVPYVGACIHVPPPPANQLVYVRTDIPFDATGLFEPVTVAGPLAPMEVDLQLAVVGYQMQAERVTPLVF